MNAPLKILIAHHFEMMRNGIEKMLKQIDSATTIYPVRNGEEALSLAPFYKANVSVINHTLPDMPAEVCIKQLSSTLPGCAIIVIAENISPQATSRFMRCGAMGFVTFDCTVHQMHKALEATLNGNNYFAPDIANTMAGHALKNMDKAIGAAPLLSQMQKKVLNHIYHDELTTYQIARLVNRSPKTIEAIRSRLMAGAGAENLAGMIKYYLRHRILIDPEI